MDPVICDICQSPGVDACFTACSCRVHAVSLETRTTIGPRCKQSELVPNISGFRHGFVLTHYHFYTMEISRDVSLSMPLCGKTTVRFGRWRLKKNFVLYVEKNPSPPFEFCRWIQQIWIKPYNSAEKGWNTNLPPLLLLRMMLPLVPPRPPLPTSGT